MTDHLEQSRRKTRLLAGGCGAVLLGVLAWVVMPISVPRVEVASPDVANQRVELPPPAPLDVKAFETPVWRIAAAPEPSTSAPATAPPAPPLKLQLIGIVREEETYKAVLYDPETNKLFVVASGLDAAGHTVERVAADAITIKDGPLVRTLALKTSGGAG